MLQSGLYEQLIPTALRRELAGIPDERQYVAPIDRAEVAELLSRYVAEVTRAVLERMQESKLDVQAQIALVNHMVSTLPLLCAGRKHQAMLVSRGKQFDSISICF